MLISEQGKSLIRGFESCRLRAYQDGGGKWTIGWGHTATAAAGMVWTQEQADKQFDRDVTAFGGRVLELVKVGLCQNRFDALVSLAYNIGTGPKGLGGSVLLTRLNEGNYRAAALQFTRWNKDNGKFIPGLLARRTVEMAVFLAGHV